MCEVNIERKVYDTARSAGILFAQGGVSRFNRTKSIHYYQSIAGSLYVIPDLLRKPYIKQKEMDPEAIYGLHHISHTV
ncbi:hypothetical protein N473_22920 [Pseudoalteromonas luteoviolacea CPMOR-1]|uniref:Uncharacterized protein n=1 Tax=Pseudoalteromonas luteoviolacea CPMOR-1 TaxID=1365248 RepID=A0A167JC48_9GAMM|nr:hypothetical protein N473_22920 [Pseudoalteromonas luteoviolacea CPMOR-1]